MTDETQGPQSEPPTGQETSLGGASEWSTVAPSPAPPTSLTNPESSASSTGQAVPNQALEPLPQPASYGSANAPTGPPVPPQPSSGPAPVGQQSYQQVYGTGQPQPSSYASAPGGGYPPQGPPPPMPEYGAPGGPGYPPQGPPPPVGQGLSSHAAAAISYLTFIPAVIFLVMAPYNRDRFVRFHAWQCIALTIVWVAVSIIFSVLAFAGLHFVGWMLMLIHMLIRIVLFIFWLIAIIKASQGQWFKIPIVGDLAQSFAGKDA